MEEDIMAKILVVDDEEVIRVTLKRILESDTVSTTSTKSAEEGLDLFRKGAFDLIITDVKMPGMDGMEFLKTVKEINPEVPVILITGFATVDLTKEALQNGAYGFITKPFDIENILEVVENGLTFIKEIAKNKEVAAYGKCAFTIELPSRLGLMGGLIYYVVEQLKLMDYPRSVISNEIVTALREAIKNAIIHGNERNPDKNVYVHTTVDHEKVEMVVRDQGAGFDPNELPEINEEEGGEKKQAGGILIIKGHMDEVKFNVVGNEVTMIRYNRKS